MVVTMLLPWLWKLCRVLGIWIKNSQGESWTSFLKVLKLVPFLVEMGFFKNYILFLWLLVESRRICYTMSSNHFMVRDSNSLQESHQHLPYSKSCNIPCKSEWFSWLGQSSLQILFCNHWKNPINYSFSIDFEDEKRILKDSMQCL